MNVQIIQKNLHEQKIGEHILFGCLMSTTWGFDHIEKNHTLYRGKNCIKTFCTYLREHAKM